jgi:DNA-binding SARP family transcriptional activator/tetratricopeptide (TPR) repeat protein
MIELRTLGELAILVSGASRRLATDKQSALLVYLSLNQGRALRREYLAGLLWEDAGERRARHSLSQALYQIRQRLPELDIEVNRDEVRVAEGSMIVDAQVFRGAIESQDFDEAAASYRGDFLAGFWVNGARTFEEWQLAERAELSRLARQILHRLVKDAEAAGDWSRVGNYATRLLKLDPLNEAVYRSRIQAIAVHEGQRQALDEYRRLATLIGAELGREPEPATRALGALLERDTVAATAPDSEELEENHWTPFIGRGEEFGRLRTEWEVVKAGGGRAVVVSGEPGIGKTRLCDHFLRLCAIQGARIFQGRCHIADRHIPYTGIVGSLLGSIRDADVASLPPEWAMVLSEIMPEFHALAPGLKRDLPLEGEGARRRLFEGFAQLFQRISATSPIVLHIDDFQWCDESSAALLHYIVRRLVGAPVLILLSMRPEGESSHMPAELLAVGEGTSPGYRQISLGPLPHQEAERIIQSFVERQLIQLPEQTRREIYARAGGRPFFIIEILRAIAQGQIDWGEGDPDLRRYGQPTAALPPTVEEFLRRSMRDLSADAEPLLSCLAVLGTRADPQVVGEVAGVSSGELIRGLKELGARGLIQESEAEIYFSHDLIREAAYLAIGKSRRRLLHAAVAEVLQRRAGVPHAVLCTHYDNAGVRERAYHHAALAAAESSRVYGHLETEYFLRIALANAVSDQEMATIKERLATLLLSLSRYPEAEGYLTDICEMDEVAGDPRRQLAIRSKLLTISLKQGGSPPDTLIDQIMTLASQAEQYGEHEIHIDLLKALINIGHNTGQRDLVLGAIERISTLANVVEDISYEVTALTVAANVIGIYKGGVAALPFAEAAVERASKSDEGRAIIVALCSRGVNRMQAGLLSPAKEDFRAVLQLIERFAAVSYQQFALNSYGVALLERGDYAEARKIFSEAIKLATDSAALQDRVVVTGNLLLVEHESGNRAEAMMLADEVLILSEQAPFLWCTIGAWSILGLYALERGDLAAAHEYHREILEHADGRDFWGSDASYTEIFFARLMTLEGRGEGALARLDEAIAAYKDRNFFCRARLQLERARLLLVSGAPEPAGRLAAEVRKHARAAGALPLVEKADAILDLLPDLTYR